MSSGPVPLRRHRSNQNLPDSCHHLLSHNRHSVHFDSVSHAVSGLETLDFPPRKKTWPQDGPRLQRREETHCKVRPCLLISIIQFLYDEHLSLFSFGHQKISFCLRYQNYLHLNIKKCKQVHPPSELQFGGWRLADKSCHCRVQSSVFLHSSLKICQYNGIAKSP